jgi:hypothetical protein
MAAPVTCPTCGRRLQLPDALAGRAVQCPNCGADFDAPLGFALDRPQDAPAPAAPPADQARQAALRQVRGVATALRFYGLVQFGLSLALVLGVLWYTIQETPRRGPRHGFSNDPVSVDMAWNFTFTWPITLGSVSAVVGLGTMACAGRMRRLEGYGSAVAACLLPLLPITGCCCVLGVPLTVWGLGVLTDPAVRAEFR